MRKFVIPFSAAVTAGPYRTAAATGTGVTSGANNYAVGSGTNGEAAAIFNANAINGINTWVNWANSLGAGVVNPEVFYSKQLLDTIRYDANEYTYYRYAEEQPIENKADKLVIRRWSPLRAHTVPLQEGVPPQSDKGVAKKYEITARAYGRYMEFSDAVDFACVDPVVAHFSQEYSIVAIETLDLLAQEALLATANKYFAGNATDFDEIDPWNAKPSMADFRLLGLQLKKQLVKPRSNGKFHVIVSPEFVYDMFEDEYVKNYMTINQNTYSVYDNGTLIPMFGFDFYEANNVPQGCAFKDGSAYKVRFFLEDVGNIATIQDTFTSATNVSSAVVTLKADAQGDGEDRVEVVLTLTSGFIAGGYDTVDYRGIKGSLATYGEFNNGYQSYIPTREDYDIAGEKAIEAWMTANTAVALDKASSATSTVKVGEATLKVCRWQHIFVLGKDAMIRTGMSGEGQAKMYVKALGSAGVLDPIDQRQSIGFKINSVGFSANVTNNAVQDYICCPSQLA